MSTPPCLDERAITRPIVTRKMTAARGAAEVRPEIAPTSLEAPSISRSSIGRHADDALTRDRRAGTLRVSARTGRFPLLAISRGRAHAVCMLGAGLDAVVRTA